MSRTTSHFPDIAAYDAEDRPVLFLDVKGYRIAGDDVRDELLTKFSDVARPGEFVAIADPERVIFYRWGSDGHPHAAAELKTPDILSHYEADAARTEIFEYYMSILLEGWLRDLALHWKSASPPGQDVLEQIGLAGRLRNGFVQPNVASDD